ncbi:hypothetical protein RFI_25878, partial [Reticulomyxa filosa]
QYLFDESVDCWIQYLKIAINTFGLSHHYVAIAYNSIGNTYYDRRQNEHAIEFYEKVLQIVVDIFGINCNFVANLYENLGNTYGEWAQYDKAIEYHMKALETRVAIFGAKHVDVALSYNRLGGIYQYKEHNKAIEYYEKSLEITLEIFGFNNDDVAYLFWTLGLEFETMGNYKTASGHFEGAWKTYTALFGEWHIRTLQAKMKRIYSQLSFFCLLANYGNPKVSIELFCFYSLVIFIVVLLPFLYFFKLKYGQIKKFHFTIDWMLKKTSNLSQRISLCLNFDIQIVYGYFLNGKDMVSYNGSIFAEEFIGEAILDGNSFFHVFLSKTIKYSKKFQICIFLINIYELLIYVLMKKRSFFFLSLVQLVIRVHSHYPNSMSFFFFINNFATEKKWFCFCNRTVHFGKKKMSFYLDALHHSTKEKKRKDYGKNLGLKPPLHRKKNQKVYFLFFILFFYQMFIDWKWSFKLIDQSMFCFFLKNEKVILIVCINRSQDQKTGKFFLFFIFYFLFKKNEKKNCEKNKEKKVGKKYGKKILFKNGKKFYLRIEKKFYLRMRKEQQQQQQQQQRQQHQQQQHQQQQQQQQQQQRQRMRLKGLRVPTLMASKSMVPSELKRVRQKEKKIMTSCK